MTPLLIILPVLLSFFTLACQPLNPPRPREDQSPESGLVESDWVDLNGPSSWQEDRGEWTEVGSVAQDPEDGTKFTFGAGKGIWVNGSSGKTHDLHSCVQHGDVEAHIEFMIPGGSNSGVYFQSRYEIQIFDSWHVVEPKYSDCGGIYQRWRDNQGYDGHPPRVNASRPPGEWQSFDVVFRAPRFDSAGNKTENARFVKIVQNGVVIHEDVELTGPTRAATFEDESAMGSLMIQGDHGPIAFKNARVKHLHHD